MSTIQNNALEAALNASYSNHTDYSIEIINLNFFLKTNFSV